MSKKKKTAFPEGLWAVFLVDRFDWEASDIQVTELLSREEAEAEYRRLTDNGRSMTYKDKDAFEWYDLRPVR